MTRREDEPDAKGTSSARPFLSVLGPGRGLPPEIAKAIAESLRERRALRGWDQRKLAELLGISQAAVSQVETGAKLPSIATLLKMREVYGFASIEQLFGELPSQTLIRDPASLPNEEEKPEREEQG